MSWTQAVGRRVGKAFKRGSLVKPEQTITPRAAGDVRLKGKIDAEVKALVAQAETAFGRRHFAEAKTAWGDALAAYETPADAGAVVTSLSRKLEEHAGQFHILPWLKTDRVAAELSGVLGNARRVVKFGDVAATIRKSQEAIAGKDARGFDEIYTYAKDLMTDIWYHYDHRGLSAAKREVMAARVEEGSWKLAEHYLAAGRLEHARKFVESAKSPVISRPTFERALREVKLYDKHGALKDVSEAQAWDLALAARNKFHFSGRPIEETQNALFEMLALALKVDSKAAPPAKIVQWLLAHARTPDEVGKLLARAESMGYKLDVKRDILGAIETPGLGGVTIDGTSAAVQAVNPTALVSFAEQHGFGAEAASTLMMALQGQRRYRPQSQNNVSLGGLIADALNLGR